MTKAQERAREYALKAWHEWDEKTENQDRDGNTLYWLGETGFIEVIARAYAQGQRDLVEAADKLKGGEFGNSVIFEDLVAVVEGKIVFDLKKLAGVKDEIR